MKNITKNLPVTLSYIFGVSSVISVLMALWGSKVAIIIALSFFCVSLLVLLAILVRAIVGYTDIVNEKPYVRLSTDIRYETEDGFHINYEIYRLIQSKRVLLQKIEHGFKWSGTKDAELSSNLQDIESVRKTGEKDDEYDSATLVFRTPLLYNETGVVHFKAKLDDSDEKSDTFVAYKATSYAELIHFRVILKHKGPEYTAKAKVFKKKIQSGYTINETEIQTIPFDHKTKTFEFVQERPEIGYFYILRWER